MTKRKFVLAVFLQLSGFGAPPVVAAQTGVPAGTVLTRYDGTYTVSRDSAVVSNLEVHGNVIVIARNVTMKHIRVVSNTPWHAVQLSEGASGFTLQDSEIDGAGKTVNAVYGFGSFLRNDLHDVENGINVIGPSIIRDNHIHSLRGGSDAHYDGIEINGGYDIDISGNTIVNDHGQTSAIMLDNYFGGLSDITIDSNHLVGGGYTVYLDGRFAGGIVNDRSISITNNRIGCGAWGNFALYGNNPHMDGNSSLNDAQTRCPASTQDEATDAPKTRP
ncbi:hypothetical protein QO002_004376 [Pararhizobium capsulatum DSM 1112]|uniref:Right handed beta helix region n=1 Tax=Pararhizobium capsulatum DSM 1112 TaxID=1121113 RepID=A0ABU0BVA7_9HYPH|nr:right-handed parallel beta-helix repeat-containing protein [Pararhizobium capsulatum]MDQ0322170.1 hypothetical protein [Pararhizobium capsulatum DSM 1112]